MQTQPISPPVPIPSIAFIRAYVITMRPYLLFVSGITVLAGLSTGDPGIAVIVVTGTAGFLSYGFGQALTDCFQTDTDALSSPYRPLVKGLVTPRQVGIVSLVGLAAVAAGLAWSNPHNLWLATIGAIGLATYTPFKRRWATGPFYNAWIVALLCYIGMVAGGTTGNLLSPGGTELLVLASAFFGYANFVLAGYFKDISADRATGYNTFPVRFGWIAAAIGSDVFAILAVVAAGALLVGIVPFPVTAVVTFFVPAVICSLIAQFRLHRIRDEHLAHRSISFVVHGDILLLAGIAAALQPTWLLPLVAFFLLYLIVLAHRPLKAQI